MAQEEEGFVGTFQFTHPGRGATFTDVALVLSKAKFQFTHPGRGATFVGSMLRSPPWTFQFTHPGRGATRGTPARASSFDGFNSRTPGGVRPGLQLGAIQDAVSFNSRTPGGVRRIATRQRHQHQSVSIHAPREGCDGAWRTLQNTTTCFNSRTPGGVRQLYG